MELDAFLSRIEKGVVPESSPNDLNGHWPFTLKHDRYLSYWQARETCTKLGMWAIVDQQWTKVLANWIGSRSVLEVMAGAGWLAKALSEHGVQAVATDDYSWDGNNHKKVTRIYPVEKLHCLEAIIKYPQADILLVSWPPYESEDITACARLWGSDRPIVYIGESQGGCNAPDSFWQGFQVLDDMPVIPLKSWDGIHDRVYIGYWGEGN